MFVGCASVNKDRIYALSPRAQKIIENLPDKQMRIEAFNMSLRHMETVDDDSLVASCRERLYEFLATQSTLSPCFQKNNVAESIRVDLGIWLGITYKKRLINAKPIRAYECSLIVAIRGGEQGYEEILVNTSFLISKPYEQESDALEQEKCAIQDALQKTSEIISAACEGTFSKNKEK